MLFSQWKWRTSGCELTDAVHRYVTVYFQQYISINITTATDNEYNKIETKIVFKIDEIIKVIEVGNHIQCQSQNYFLVNDYQSTISSEIANLNEALENICFFF